MLVMCYVLKQVKPMMLNESHQRDYIYIYFEPEQSILHYIRHQTWGYEYLNIANEDN